MARKQPPPGYLARLGALARTRLGRLLGAGFVASVVLLGVGGVVNRARAYAHGLPAYRLDGSSIHFLDFPDRLGPRIRGVLEDPRTFKALDVSVFDPDAEQRVRDLVAAHPMVESVRSVRIVYPCRADVRITVRRPAAWFYGRLADGSRGWMLVASDQHRLDHRSYDYYLERLSVPLPRVVGVREYAPSRAGQRWADHEERVAEGLAAADVARRLYADLGGRIVVERIDLSRFPARPEFRHEGEVRFVLRDGRTIEWGRTERDLEGVAGEDGYEVKQWRLERELLRSRPGDGRRIDVRYPLPSEARRRE